MLLKQKPKKKSESKKRNTYSFLLMAKRQKELQTTAKPRNCTQKPLILNLIKQNRRIELLLLMNCWPNLTKKDEKRRRNNNNTIH